MHTRSPSATDELVNERAVGASPRMMATTPVERAEHRPRDLDRVQASSRELLLGAPYREPWSRWYAAVLVALDVAAIGIAARAASAAGLAISLSVNGTPQRRPHVVTMLVLSAAWLMVLGFSGAYRRRWLGTGSEEFRRVFEGAGRFLAVVALATFLLDVRLGRSFVAVTIVLAAVTSVALRCVLRRWLHSRRARGRFMKRVVIVGPRSDCSELAHCLLSTPHAGLLPVGACCGETAEDLAVAGALMPVLGEPARALNAALSLQADAIAIAGAGSLEELELGRLAAQLEGTEIELLVHSGVAGVVRPQISVHPVFDLPLVQVEELGLKGLPRVVKGAADRLVAFVALLVLAPFLVVISLVIRVSSRGPVIFRQVRVGLGGRHFKVWKFRTMVRDAESRLSSLMHLNEQDGVLFKMRNDPRVTRVGRVLRRWSLDELPQLWNVLRGDMSLVGPRPPIPSEVARYEDRVHPRLLVKPGMTGLWQVSGRAELLWEEAVRLDLHYAEHWSLSMDAAILGRTCMAVVRQRGAY